MSATMTRDEFIDCYMARSGFGDRAERMPLGFRRSDIGDWIALPCDCGYEGCSGWAMMPNTLSVVVIHCDLHLPPGYEALVFQMRCTACSGTWSLPCDRKLMNPLVQHEIVCPHCGNGDFLNHLYVESYSGGPH
jgi:hypothetical protein